MIIPPQAAYLYYGSWSHEVDEIVLNTIIRLKAATNWVLHDFPHWFVITAQQEVEAKMSIQVTESDLKQRLDFMKLRYDTFKSLQADGASWDVGAEFVRASDDLWARIIQKTPFAGAYYHRDDPHFSKLACLFGLGEVKKEEDAEVVLISDGTEKVSADEPSCYEVTGCDAEVTSPAFVPPRTIRRKLFPEDGEPPTDRESTNEIGICFIDLDAEGKLYTRFEKGRDLPIVPDGKKDKAGPSRFSPNTSSCASNSPKQRWPYIYKKPKF